MRMLATVCARGGSKGVKNKNIRELAGKPLIAYTIECLRRWDKADRIVCSTDSEEIAAVAKKFGAEVPCMRPAELATDNAAKIDAIKHIVKFCEEQEHKRYDVVVDLDPTAPLRTAGQVNEALEKFLERKPNNLYSVCRARRNPYFNMVELDEEGYAHLCKKSSAVRRQDSPAVYDMNASIYIYDRDFLMGTDSIHSDKTIVFEMPEIAIDIDSELDLKIVEFLIEKEVFRFE